MRTVEIIFSPTGGTEKAAHIIGKQWSDDTIRIDLCDAKTDFSSCKIDSGDFVLIAMPSYGGRAPFAAIERLGKIAGNGARCTLVCVYGNRAYEDTLAEMQDASEKAGFHVIAAVSAVAEHSIMHQYAAGRPDDLDRKQLAGFALKIRDKLEGGNLSTPHLPGNRPYKKAGAGLVPKAGKACVSCGLCAEKCPMEAINPASPMDTDGKKCIGCMRCVSLCPHNARKVNSAMVSVAALAIKKACSVRKENELFL